jgi:hypothetical protein
MYIGKLHQVEFVSVGGVLLELNLGEGSHSMLRSEVLPRPFPLCVRIFFNLARESTT